jgi:hypothetical protein
LAVQPAAAAAPGLVAADPCRVEEQLDSLGLAERLVLEERLERLEVLLVDSLVELDREQDLVLGHVRCVWAAR